MATVKLAIKNNNFQAHEHCVLCGAVCEQEIGPVFTLANGWGAVCDECAAQHDSWLFAVLYAWRAQCRGVPSGTTAEERQDEADREHERRLEAAGYADWRRQHEQNTVTPATCCHCGGALLVYADGSTRAPELRRQHEQEA